MQAITRAPLPIGVPAGTGRRLGDLLGQRPGSTGSEVSPDSYGPRTPPQSDSLAALVLNLLDRE
jgi:hypothetical protein